MSLRRTVFLTVFLAVLATAALEGVFDVIVDRLDAAGPAEPAGETGTGVARRLLLDLADFPLMLVIALGGAWLIARRIARPLDQVTGAIRKVADQTFPEELVVPAGNDELARLTLTFNSMAKAIQGYVERERTFTRYASHELRTPLSALRLQLERAELGLVPAADVLPALRRNVTQLEEILVALLALARSPHPEAGSRQLAQLLEESLASFPSEQRTRVKLTDDSPARLEVTHARLLQQALTNLLDNALRHGSGGADVRVAAQGDSVTVSVLDRGPGLAPAELDRVTEPYFRGGESTRATEASPHVLAPDGDGLGLGLAFVAFIAKALEGSLSLSNTGSGLEARLTLPIVARHA